MIKTIFYILLFSSTIFAGERTTDAELKEALRLKYYSAVENEDSVDIFEEYINSLSDKFNDDNLINAYRGALFAVRSKHAFWPFTKLTYLKDSMALLGQAVNNAPENLEIRFIRFSILHYVPDFLGWIEEKNSDRKKILKLLLENNYGDIPNELVVGITQFLVDSERISESDAQVLNNKILLTLEK